jgi:glycosyltransferase involved in cell wall biosynthesis
MASTSKLFESLGDGPKSEIARLEELATALGVRDDVDFVPATTNPFPYMTAARTLALPSFWEGSSNVLLEAMACGTPVIASRTAGDAQHVLRHGQYGILVDPGDTEGLASSLLQQISSNPVVPGNRASSFAQSPAMQRYIQLFDQLMDEAAATRVGRIPVRGFSPVAPAHSPRI